MNFSSFGSVKFQRHGEKSGYRYSNEVASSAAGAAGFIHCWITWSVVVALCTLSICAMLFGAKAKGRKVSPPPALEVSYMPVSTDSISEHERATIIAHVAEHGKWEGRIGRAQVEVARHDSAGPMFSFGVVFQKRTKDGWRITADAAIDAAAEAIAKLIDPLTGIAPIAEWGSACQRGFVSDARFGPGQTVIKRTNRDVTRKWRAIGEPV